MFPSTYEFITFVFDVSRVQQAAVVLSFTFTDLCHPYIYISQSKVESCQKSCMMVALPCTTNAKIFVTMTVESGT